MNDFREWLDSEDREPLDSDAYARFCGLLAALAAVTEERDRLAARLCRRCENRGTIFDGSQPDPRPRVPCPDCAHGAVAAERDRLAQQLADAMEALPGILAELWPYADEGWIDVAVEKVHRAAGVPVDPDSPRRMLAYKPLPDEACAACGHIYGDHRDDDLTCGHDYADGVTSCACPGFEADEQ